MSHHPDDLRLSHFMMMHPYAILFKTVSGTAEDEPAACTATHDAERVPDPGDTTHQSADTTPRYARIGALRRQRRFGCHAGGARDPIGRCVRRPHAKGSTVEGNPGCGCTRTASWCPTRQSRSAAVSYIPSAMAWRDATSACRAELVPALFEERATGTVGGASRNVRERQPVEALEAVHEHRAIHLAEDVVADVHDQVGADTHDVAIERGVVQTAQREAVRYDRLASLRIRRDMGGVDKFAASQPTHRTRTGVGAQHLSAKPRLVHSHGHDRAAVSTRSCLGCHVL